MTAANLSVVLVYLHIHGIPHALGCRAYLLVWWKVGALCVEHSAVFVPCLPHPLLSTMSQCDRCQSSRGRGGSWLGCHVLPAIGAVSNLELAASSGSSRMSRAPNLHRATTLFINIIVYNFSNKGIVYCWSMRVICMG